MSHPFSHWQQRVDQNLRQVLPTVNTSPPRLCEAIHYALFNGGKRIRPALVYATGELFKTPIEQLDAAAVAVELIHSYSLVHDDLPAMDDDDLRRGQPTCHRAFDEATAVLVGDAMQTIAFQTLVDAPVSAEIRLQWIKQLTTASGAEGMVGGQMMDLVAEGCDISHQTLNTMYQKKTGSLIIAAILMGAAPAQPAPATTESLQGFADSIGLAFQVQDDILDIEGSSTATGKPQDSDLVQGKTTFVTLFGVEEAKKELRQLHKQAKNHLNSSNNFGDSTKSLLEIANFIVNRNH